MSQVQFVTYYNLRTMYFNISMLLIWSNFYTEFSIFSIKYLSRLIA